MVSILSAFVAAIFNSGTITGNNVQDYFSATLATAGINLSATGNSAWTISNNKLFQSATRIYTTANTHNGIFVGTGSGYTISGNTIGFANASGTGTTNMVGGTVALTGNVPLFLLYHRRVECRTLPWH